MYDLQAARAYFESLSARAQRNGTTVHAFGVGEASFAVRETLRPLTAGCGGGVYLHAGFKEQAMLKDMLHALFRGIRLAAWLGVVLRCVALRLCLLCFALLLLYEVWLSTFKC